MKPIQKIDLYLEKFFESPTWEKISLGFVVILCTPRLIFALLFLILILSIMIPAICRNIGSPEAVTRLNAYTMKNAIEFYAVNHDGKYPSDITALWRGGYLNNGLPQNPFNNTTMKQIAFGDNVTSGDFTYIPVIRNQQVYGYYLLVYGKLDKPGKDVNDDGKPDHVLIKLIPKYMSEEQLIPLKKLLE